MDTGPKESLISLDNYVKECHVILEETLFGECTLTKEGQQVLDSIQVLGSVKVKACLPDDTPKV